MKHLQDIDGFVNESEFKTEPLGFVFYFNDQFHVGAAETFQDFARQVSIHWGCHDQDLIYFDFHYLLQALYDGFGEESLVDTSVLWTGLQPKKAGFTMYGASNPVWALDGMLPWFSNLNEIMKQYEGGNWGDPTYLAKSIENRPELLGEYLESYESSKPGDEYESAFTLDAIFRKLSRGFRESDHFRHFLRYHRFKGTI